MESDEAEKSQRAVEMQRLIDLADDYYTKHGRFPAKIRVGVNIGNRLFPKGAIQAVTPNFTAMLDESLGPDDVILNA